MIFEILMLVCFSISWPISIAKSIRTKVVAGKSPVFMAVVILGYICGIFYKCYFRYDAVILLYIFNAILVMVDIFVYFWYRDFPTMTGASVKLPNGKRIQIPNGTSVNL